MSYRQFHFEQEPFKPSLKFPMRGRDEEWKKITAFLSESLQGQGTRGFLLLSDYGYGKTFFMNKIREQLEDPNSNLPKSEETICSPVVLAETEPASSTSFEYVTKVFEGIGCSRIFEIAGNIREADIALKDFSRSFKPILEGLLKESEEAFLWLTGVTLTPEQRKALNVTSKFNSKDSLVVFLDFLRMMKLAGFSNLVVLVDEFEYAVNVYSQKNLTSLFHTFKNIYDKFTAGGGSTNFANHIQFLAMTPRGWEVVTDLEAMKKKVGGGGITPWLERMRFEKNQLTLGPVSDEAGMQIITDRINEMRVKFKKVPYNTFPFIQPSFFDQMLKMSGGKPRNLLDFSEIVLEEAAKQGLKEISGADAVRILQGYGLASK